VRRFASLLLATAFLCSGAPGATAQPSSAAPPVVFVHGMGSNAADTGEPGPGSGSPGQFQTLLEGIASRYPRGGVCQDAAQPDRSWDGSPCVFRYIEDKAEADEGGDASRGPNDSQSAVRPNAEKLAREVSEVFRKAGRGVVLIGYSMGGTIIRTYLAEHRRDAERHVDAVVMVHAAASGSWGYALAQELPRRFEGFGGRVAELLQSATAAASAVDLRRPASKDLRPRSELLRSVASKQLPQSVSYYTFWGDIKVVIGRRLLTYDLPSFDLPSFGDLGLLPGDPDPAVLPELGGQRFSPDVDDAHEALDIGHQASIELGSDVIGDLVDACGQKPRGNQNNCSELVAGHFDIPNVHTSIPITLDRITVDEPRLGGVVTILQAILNAIGRAR
jgi:pimeloyl-ACP methyl ester carboxylesterase